MERAGAEGLAGLGRVAVGQLQRRGLLLAEMLRRVREGERRARRTFFALQREGLALQRVLEAVIFQIALEKRLGFLQIGLVHVRARALPAAIRAHEQRGAAAAHGVEQADGLGGGQVVAAIEGDVHQQLGEQLVGLALVLQNARQILAQIGLFAPGQGNQRVAAALKQRVQKRKSAQRGHVGVAQRGSALKLQRGQLGRFADGRLRVRRDPAQQHFQLGQRQTGRLGAIARVGVGPQKNGVVHMEFSGRGARPVLSIYKDMRKRNQKCRKTKGMERKIEKTAPLRGKGAFIGLILALASGFSLLLALYAGLLVMLSFSCLGKDTITSGLALKTTQCAFQ